MASQISRDLANVRHQLKTEHTRGTNPRPLRVDEIRDLRRQLDKLLARKKEVANKRAVARIERHTTTEADRVVQAVHQDGIETRNVLQPLVALVAGAEGTSIEERLKAKRNQIAFLRAEIRELLEQKRQDRAAAAAASAAERSSSGGPKRKRGRTVATGSAAPDGGVCPEGGLSGGGGGG